MISGSLFQSGPVKWSVSGTTSLFLVGFAAFFLATPYRVDVYDEGLILTGALRILAGEKPSADFYTNYGPAQFYLVAWVLEFFGRSVTVGRVYDALIAAAILPVALWSLRDAAKGWYSFAAAGVVFALVLSFRVSLYPVTPCIVLMLIGCQVTIRVLNDHADAMPYLWVAFVIGALTSFRYDFLLLGTAAFVTPILFVLALRVWSGAVSMASAVATILKATLFVGLTAAVLLGGFYAAGILKPALHDILTYNSGNYVKMRALPFPDLAAIRDRPFHAAVIYLPPIACLHGIVTCLLCGRSGSAPSDKRLVQVAVFTSATLFFYAKGVVRTHPVHTLRGRNRTAE